MQEKYMGHICPIGRSKVFCFKSLKTSNLPTIRNTGTFQNGSSTNQRTKMASLQENYHLHFLFQTVPYNSKWVSPCSNDNHTKTNY